MSWQFIRSDSELATFIEAIDTDRWIAFDTEFHSEGKFRLTLCLLQVATKDRLVLIDPTTINDLTPFWHRICRNDTQIIVHAARSEMEFCHLAIGTFPYNIFDIQLAAAFAGFDYPLSFKTLAESLLNRSFMKSETRSNWLARPLSTKQIDYALGDVRYLKEMTDKLNETIEQKGRSTWVQEELNLFGAALHKSFNREPWISLCGIKGFSRHQLAIVRALWHWRNEESVRTESSPGRILRDDLLVELAQRSNPGTIRTLRGLERQPHLTAVLSKLIQEAKNLPENELPDLIAPKTSTKYQEIIPFLTSALGIVAGENQLPLTLLASAQELRNYLAYRFDKSAGTPPSKLATGWRYQLVGPVLEQILQGKLAMKLRIAGRPNLSLIDTSPNVEP